MTEIKFYSIFNLQLILCEGSVSLSVNQTGSFVIQRYLEEDFFELFPSEIRPWNAMLLWGTAFSRSALHIDPYNWTGTNAVLYGTKTWKVR